MGVAWYTERHKRALEYIALGMAVMNALTALIAFATGGVAWGIAWVIVAVVSLAFRSFWRSLRKCFHTDLTLCSSHGFEVNDLIRIGLGRRTYKVCRVLDRTKVTVRPASWPEQLYVAWGCWRWQWRLARHGKRAARLR